MTYELSKELRGFQYEVEAQTKISFNVHCAKCGKFKLKYTKSKYCLKCLGLKWNVLTEPVNAEILNLKEF